MDEDEVYESETGSGYEFRWQLPVIRVLAFVASLFGVTGRLFSGLAEDLVEHVNYKTERDQFAADAGRELETLLEGPEED
jgi:hypothetical protein